MKTVKFILYYLQELALQCTYKVKLLTQKVLCGFQEREVYQLNSAIVDFVLPRLKSFREEVTNKKFSKEIDAMIWSLENLFSAESFTTKDGIDKIKFNQHQRKLAKGLALFGASWWLFEK